MPTLHSEEGEGKDGGYEADVCSREEFEAVYEQVVEEVAVEMFAGRT